MSGVCGDSNYNVDGSRGASGSRCCPPSGFVPPLSSNAVSRSFSDLHTYTWFAFISLNAVVRTALLHPLHLAIARKRVTREDRPPSVLALITAAYRGEIAGGASDKTKRGGWRAVYRGFGAAALGNLIGEVTYLYIMETVKETLSCSRKVHRPPQQEPDFTASSFAAAASGMAGEFASLFLVTPIAVICNRQMTAGYGMAANNTYQTFLGTMRDVCSYHNTPSNKPQTKRACHALRSAYSGLVPGIMTLPASGIWWALYSKAKVGLYTIAEPTLSRWERERDPSERYGPVWRYNWLLSPTDNPAINASAGVIASCVTTLMLNPLEVIHTRMQALPPVPTSMRRLPFASLRIIVGDLLIAEGWRGLFKGTVANVGASVVDGMMFSLFFEMAKLGSDREFLNRL
ncbi:putative Mitochondrial carrier protein [Trypanosoma vivax]|uniref:Putative mitochondrial carrier protein n=1 Tax=Trypanosoma vivax (strain Y486) TaxID=1055687 RepID=G0U466_TRYVY|nr:putative carrier protein [Trypanosoma vivax]KAH8611929.1 putative Mitochondrial carrier protein [Trypanosoma vivax]CCC52228.1 putative mitochondrial carrier protein [Trypanosoma vivax Y486]